MLGSSPSMTKVEKRAHCVNTEILDILQGNWDFERCVSYPTVSLKGTAVFEPLAKNTLSYHESGTYVFDSTEYDFFQKRTFYFENNSIVIFKNDGALLHQFDGINTLYPSTSTHLHLCGSDTYHCVLTLNSTINFSMHYSIKGPNKDYTIRTLYRKLS